MTEPIREGDEVPEPCGHTCPGIDRAIRAAHRVVRVAGAYLEVAGAGEREVADLAAGVAVLVAELERVRAENGAMRDAYHGAMSRRRDREVARLLRREAIDLRAPCSGALPDLLDTAADRLDPAGGVP